MTSLYTLLSQILPVTLNGHHYIPLSKARFILTDYNGSTKPRPLIIPCGLLFSSGVSELGCVFSRYFFFSLTVKPVNGALLSYLWPFRTFISSVGSNEGAASKNMILGAGDSVYLLLKRQFKLYLQQEYWSANYKII